MSGLRRIIAAIQTRDETRPVQVGHTSPPLSPVPFTTTPNPEVVLVLDLEHAEALARLLIRFDAMADTHVRDHLDFAYDPQLWNHTAIELLSSAALAGPHPFPVYATAVGDDLAGWFG